MVVCSRDLFVHVFPDGTTNHFHLSAMDGNAGYADIARWAGYGDDWRRYGLEHELGHHFIADTANQPWSYSVHDNPPTIDAPHVAREEHVVNELQRWSNGIRDDPYGQLRDVLGDDPDYQAELFKMICHGALGSLAWSMRAVV